MNAEYPDRGGLSRGIAVSLAVVLGVAVAGFLVGIRPMPRPDLDRWRQSVDAGGEAQLPPTAYWELRNRPAGPNSAPTSDLAFLRAGLPDVTDGLVRDARERADALEQRAARRAFEGAPPVIPHAVDEQGATACLACHAEGIEQDGRVARVMSHDFMANCTQCHVSVFERMGSPAVTTASLFAGRKGPGAGRRAWAGAPPRIPHSTWMREACNSCHGVAGLPGIRTTHPERRSCEQCHAATVSSLPWDGAPRQAGHGAT